MWCENVTHWASDVVYSDIEFEGGVKLLHAVAEVPVVCKNMMHWRN